jgi:ABC-type multidrug transport system ATPase subunit
MDDVFNGELKNKTRVMVTHHLSLLEGVVDKVILIANGKIIQSGTFDDVKKTKEYQDFARASESDDNKNKDEITENKLTNDNSGQTENVNLDELAQKPDQIGKEVPIDDVV